MSDNPFEQAAAAVQGMKKLNNEQKLQFYGLYKQATEGNNKTSKPWIFELEKASKWEAWNKNANMSKEDAQKKYIDTAYEIINKYTS